VADEPTLSIATDKVCYILSMARQFDVKEEMSDPDSGSNASDDGMVDVLEDTPNDAIQQELVTFIRDLDVDEQIELVALTWLGRGDGDLADWETIKSDARDAHTNRTASYLTGIPLLSDYLQEGLSMFGETCEDFEARNQ